MPTTRRKGKPYIWTTWLAKILGGNRCVWAVWFKSRFKYEKFEEQATDLVRWNQDHTKLMAARKRALEQDGWKVFIEDQNAFQLEGTTAIVAGKPDLIAIKGDNVLIVDGKTGRERESDIWQVLIYLYALPKNRLDLATKALEGEVHYKDGDVTLTPAELTESRLHQLFSLIKTIGADTPPLRVPTREECKRCNIGFNDCPDRVGAVRPTAVGEF